MGHKTFPVLNGDKPSNVYGRACALIDLLRHESLLPDCHIYGVGRDGVDPDMLFINGEPAGKTDAEVTEFIWRMRKCWATNGYLFEAEAEAA